MNKKEHTEMMITILKNKIKNFKDLKKGTNNINTVAYCDRGIENAIKNLKVLGVEYK